MLIPAKLVTIWQKCFKKWYYMTAEDTIYTFQTKPAKLTAGHQAHVLLLIETVNIYTSWE